MKRRIFLLGGVAALGGAGLWQWRRGKSVPTAPPDARGQAAQVVAEPAAARPAWLEAESVPWLLGTASVLVPSLPGRPGIEAIDLVPTLSAWAERSEARLRVYTVGWPVFENALRTRASAFEARAEAQHLEPVLASLYQEYRGPSPSVPARVFEQLRRDVLRVYYASPAGWHAVGYRGPHQDHHEHADGSPA